ncbi:GumC family protein [Solitalea koreensis]|uniref:non-specific protein-tyrosine kinase n=1 Tax=Solitalea koreensis TaxID=543615 RepID=A0A521ANU9_9SPHI|nr:polysaccharide biosynthesis tyrosine autokinase [Solitalea koreensis]SMO36487.1 capsular exopolysaccharide family [Solitalea koreensis]
MNKLLTTSQKAVPFQTAVPPEVGIMQFLLKCLRKWPYFLLSLVIAFIGGFIYLKLNVPIYQITASILVKQQSKKDAKTKESVMNELNVFDNDKVVVNEMEVFKSRLLMHRVVDLLGINVTYFSHNSGNFLKGQWVDKELYKVSPIRVHVEKLLMGTKEEPLIVEMLDDKRYRMVDTKAEHLFGDKISDERGVYTVSYNPEAPITGQKIKVKMASVERVAQNYLDNNLSVTVAGKDASVFSLKLEDAVPEKGKDILNALIVEYNKSAVNEKNKEAAVALNFIEERLKLVTGELSNAEEKVEEYKSSKEITDISSQSAQLLEMMKENDAQLNQVNIQLSQLNSIGELVAKSNGGGSIPSTAAANDPVLQNRITKLNELELEKAKLLQTTSENNPMVQGYTTQIENAKAGIVDNIQATKQALQITRNSLQSNNARFESTVRTVPKKERQLVNVERQKSIKQDLYTYLLQKREETALAYAAMILDSQVVDPAQSTIDPVRPSAGKTFVLASLLGLLIPVFSIWVKELINNKIKARETIEDATKAPIVGVIGKSSSRSPLVVSAGSRTALSEQFRFLRTNLQYIDVNNKNKILLVTSSITAEGKSFVSLNLGSSLAISGKKTVILELDLRKPGISKAIGVKGNFGITDYLRGEATLDNIIKMVSNNENLYLISSGETTENPIELLMGERVSALFQELNEKFDYVIIDSPPIGLVADALLIEKFVDATIYVVRYGHTQLPQLKMIADFHEAGKFKNMSIVFNGVDFEQSYGYGYTNTGYYEPVKSRKQVLKKLKAS